MHGMLWAGLVCCTLTLHHHAAVEVGVPEVHHQGCGRWVGVGDRGQCLVSAAEVGQQRGMHPGCLRHTTEHVAWLHTVMLICPKWLQTALNAHLWRPGA